MASLLAKQPQQRQSTRSNSASSSSVVTVQRATSSRSASRPSASGLTSHSPSEINFNPANLSIQNLSPDTRRRSSAGYSRPGSSNGVREGVGNLNRWSQSTVSSNSSATHNRKGSFSKRLSGSFGSFGTFANPHSSSPNTKGVGKFRPSTSTSPEEPSKTTFQKQPTHRPTHQIPTLPPIVTLSSLSQAVDAADSPSTAATATPATADLLSPAIYQPDPDYFGSRWRPRSPLSQQSSSGPLLPKTSPLPSSGSIATSPKPNARSSSHRTEVAAISTDRAVSKYSQRGSVQQKKRRQEQNSSHVPDREEENRVASSAETDCPAAVNDRYARERGAPSQKAMLSKALQKAKHAVLLDNAQNFEGAMDAYGDACALLQSVMQRSSGDEYRMKLESVRTTYSNRINELRTSDLSYQAADGKALPSRPGGRDSSEQEPILPLTDEEDDVITMGNATAARLVGEESVMAESIQYQGFSRNRVGIPPRRHSLRPPASRLEDRSPQFWNSLQSEPPPQDRQLIDTQKRRRPTITRARTLEPAIYHSDMPPPLSPRRLQSHTPPPQNPPPPLLSAVNPLQAPNGHPERPHHVRQETAESTSWLDTIDESGGSSASSVHSRTSSIGLRRKRIRAASGATEAEFDAALDAAVEAAYDDGLEPVNDDYYGPEDVPDVPSGEEDNSASVSDTMQNNELAKERVREAEREVAISAAKDRERKRLQQKPGPRGSLGSGLSDDEADDEERMLEEMTRGYVLDSDYNMQSKSALPRQSDSSSFSGRTWGSSIASNPTSAGTSFSVPAGAPALPSLPAELQAKQMPPPAHPPPSMALPNLPNPVLNGNLVKSPSGAPPNQRISNPGVRERRLSGLKAGQLKIETNAEVLSALVAPAPKTQPPSSPAPLSTSSITEPPKSAFAIPESRQALPGLAIPSPANATAAQPTARKGSSLPGPGSAETTPNTVPPMPSLYQVTTADSEDSVPSAPESPARLTSKGSAGPGTLRKNFSSSSLKKMLTVSMPENSETGSSSSTAKQWRLPASTIPTMPTPKGANFIVEAIPSGGIHLFDSDIHSPISPGSPNPMSTYAPSPLEPCPESTLLRPFWFMRCIYQSITHPRGAYITTRLFLPRDIWKVTNVKLKNVDEKVSSCDLLTATLLNLAKVNTFDANAVLEEMQGLEQIMEQSQAVLSKRLGSEVGVSGAAWLAKGSGEMASSGEVYGGKSGNAGTKSYLSSWRKKMLKNSSMGAGFAASTISNKPKDGDKEAPVMSSLPMTTSQHSRFPRRDLRQVEYVGPHSHYMGALARLCDAAQFLDQIARDVEDPGLKHSSPAHVGLELSMRHAAEFFGFYICRFILNDITMMLDKFIKRGSQWVLT
ncbi:MAG: hypothetical protein LQ343_004623 [Gyalolechia ehrenbergii]|nr:MAG: hypothetical protein LQ343_004623 [Gyalolechia ehrenbergii]